MPRLFDGVLHEAEAILDRVGDGKLLLGHHRDLLAGQQLIDLPHLAGIVAGEHDLFSRVMTGHCHWHSR